VAYREAAADAIRNNHIIECLVEADVKIAFEYPFMNQVMRIVKEDGPTIISQYFDMDCEMTLRIRTSELERLRSRLAKVDSLRFID
jgi:putative IMPACT (imprinted ancient) family translation regulator